MTIVISTQSNLKYTLRPNVSSAANVACHDKIGLLYTLPSQGAPQSLDGTP